MPAKKTSLGTTPPETIHANLRHRLLLEQHILGGTPPFGIDKMTTVETANYIGVAPQQLRSPSAREELGLPVPYGIGKKMFWRRSELDRWIETKRPNLTIFTEGVLDVLAPRQSGGAV
jgi:hypothetical protein